ncbi:uncharacterized protein PHACADRAFT_164437 [Phanerochaete carnosa HHB-10118-sp]|uniref:Uncharacterized protein n=1 Tax=Phanerochaete carnosa (strain HHB-10118-sp) TaxID=650164 RepID=K5W088_PHACS|nr:uncharacterized protein PHACADRAFT_164437 [Phanerochaete carnosa HHB-10118-sp]EKM52505.1 hypothetical protein PHACADRAFT_164437 [Phanerochaete carnosa HHB-10118-sp]
MCMAVVSEGMFVTDKKTKPSNDDGTLGLIELNLRAARFLAIGDTVGRSTELIPSGTEPTRPQSTLAHVVVLEPTHAQRGWRPPAVRNVGRTAENLLRIPAASSHDAEAGRHGALSERPE